MRAIVSISSFTILLLVSLPVVAWNSDGHEAIAAIADKLIAGTPAATQTRKILGSNLRTAAIWADCAKNVKQRKDGTFYYQVNPTFPDCKTYESAASQKVMVDFVRRNWSNCKLAPGDEPCHKQYHYTDIAIQHDAYANNLVGTSDHDIVAAIIAAIAVLQDQPSPPPIRFTNKKEALRALVHYVGDIHQPLHVASVYLTAKGTLVNPDEGTDNPATHTIGGNALMDRTRKLHAEWDGILIIYTADRLTPPMIEEARSVPPTRGDLATWSAAWATDSLTVGKKAFANVKYLKQDATHNWPIQVPADYNTTRNNIQRDQLIKGGARLAQVLQTIYP